MEGRAVPRSPRPAIAGIPRLVSMVGHNHADVLRCTEDYATFLACLEEGSYEVDCALHAFALMSDRVLLLCTPQSADALPRFIQTVNRQFTLLVNRRWGRCGTLWSGRYRAALVEPTGFLLTAYRFVDGFASRMAPAELRDVELRCSYSHHVGSRRCAFIVEHDVYRRMGPSPLERRARYQEVCRSRLRLDVISSIEMAIHSDLVLGSDEFRECLAREHGIRVCMGTPGRPPTKLGDQVSLPSSYAHRDHRSSTSQAPKEQPL